MCFSKIMIYKLSIEEIINEYDINKFRTIEIVNYI